MTEPVDAYVLTDDDINAIADLATAGDPRAMQVPNGSVAALIARLRDAEGELAALRAQLGEPEEEWAADGPGGWMQWPVPSGSEAFARSVVAQAAGLGIAVTLKHRLAGEWREG